LLPFFIILYGLTYIIFSPTLDKFYTGACQSELNSRIENHNNSFFGTNHFTSKAKDWVLYLSFKCDECPHAIRLERKIKVMKSRKYIQNLKQYLELREKIYLETQKS